MPHSYSRQKVTDALVIRKGHTTHCGGEGTELLLLGTLEDGNEGGDGEDGKGSEHWEGCVAELVEDGLFAVDLSTEGGNKTKHGKATVDGLGCWAREGHGICGGGGETFCQ